jgi:hypothetical protein
VAAEREAIARLETGDAEGALQVLKQRTDRTKGSRLLRISIQALVRLLRWDEAEAQLGPALQNATESWNFGESLELRLLGAAIALEKKDWAAFDEHLDRAIRIAVDSSSSRAHLRALLLRLRAERLRPGGNERGAISALEQAFIDTEDGLLRHNQPLTLEVLNALGSHSAQVLRKAASAFGNRSDQELIFRDAFKLSSLLDKVGVTSVGKARLSSLAGEVGLSRTDFKVRDLARQVVRHGKLGDALVAVLDYAGHDEGVRVETASMFRSFE